MDSVLIDARERFAQRQAEWKLAEEGISPSEAGLVCEECGQEFCPPYCPYADLQDR